MQGHACMGMHAWACAYACMCTCMQARELLMKDIKTHKQRTLRSKMLDDIRSFPAHSLRRSETSFETSFETSLDSSDALRKY